MMVAGAYNSYNPYAFYTNGSTPVGYAQVAGSLAAGAGNTVQNADEVQKMDTDHKVKKGYKSSPADCKTCRERKYQDGSDEADVSFKSPGHISPQASASTVMAHEKQHVANAYQKAAQKDGKVVSCSVSLHTAVCPECGTVYVSGGTTSTAITYPNESNPYQKNKKAQDAIRLIGANINYAA